MPISPSPTQVGLSVANAAELSTVSVTQSSAGEIAYKRDDKTYWSLDLSVGASGGFPTASGQGRWVPFTAAAGAPLSTLVFQPGGVAGGNVVTTWTALKAYISANAEPQIIFDLSLVPGGPSFVLPESIDAGYGRWMATPESIGTFTVTVPDGVTITRPPTFDVFLQVNVTPTTTPSFAWPASVSQPSLTVIGGAGLTNSGTIPAFAATALMSALFFECHGSSSSFLNDGAPIVDVPAPFTPIILATQTGAASTFGAGFSGAWITGNASASLYYEATDAGFIAPGIAPGFAGSVFFSGSLDLAQSVAYAPANGGNWAPPSPQTVAAALDRLANTVALIWGNPIP